MKTASPNIASFALVGLIGCSAAAGWDSETHEPIVGGPSEGAEAIFQGLPEELTSNTRIAPPGEPGEPLRITGTVKDQGGDPVPGIIVYAYHTNDRGIYPPNEQFPGLAAYRHGTLRAWVKTDDDGRYRFDTIRPAGYPDSSIEQHVHMQVLEPGRCTYWIDSIVFTDDPRLTAEMRKQRESGRGGSGLATPKRDEDGTWLVKRNIILGKNVPEYPPRN